MKNIIIAFICISLNTCCLQKSDHEKIDNNFNFNLLFQKSELRNKIKIVNVKEYDYFEGNLSGCNKSFYIGLIKNQMYYIKNHKNDIIVEEYIFNDNVSSKKSFQNVAKYSDFVRKLKRKDYGQGCYPIWDEQVYYAINKDNHIYLLTIISNNMFFKDGNTSVDDIFKNNKEILIDDLYNDLKQ